MGFVIHGARAERIGSLEEWARLAPPAGREKQWREGRSAMELARRWAAGTVPDEVRRVLESHPAFQEFEPIEAWAEHKTALDGYGGNTRNHDLLLVGRCGDDLAVVDIEGKADESFGSLVGRQLIRAREAMSERPGSMALARVEELCRSVLGTTAAAASDLRYQLIHGVAAAVIAAETHGAKRAAWLVHEFRVGRTNEHALRRNARDLEAFVGRLSGQSGPATLTPGTLLGPWRLPGGGRVSSDVDLYIGKALWKEPL